MNKLSWYAVAGLALVALGPGASAQDTSQIPDLRGRWVGTNEAIVMGNAPHHPLASSPQEKPRMTSVEFTFTVEGQDGRRIWGTSASPGFKEAFVGMVRFDGKTVSVQDSDGAIDATLLDPDTLEVIYRHSASHSVVVALSRIKRQR
jgi:hypothetical protein